MYSRFPILHKATVLYTRLFSSTWSFKRVDELKDLGNGFFGQTWPFLSENLISHCAVCWNCLPNVFPTTVLSATIIIALPSKNGNTWTQSAGNQRHNSSLVGTSETKRATTFTNFFSWLAGVIDGDGSLLVSKQGYTSLEITMGLEDLALLRYIQDKLGGSIKMRSGAKAYRYRLMKKGDIIKLIQGINGHIRHSARLLQLHKVCSQLGIPVISPIPLTSYSPWFSGFFDADGTVGFYMKNLIPQLTISVSNKLLIDLETYKVVFGGNIYFDKAYNGHYKWSIQSKTDVFNTSKLLLTHCRSHKSKRFFLVEEYYSLVNLSAYKSDNINHKAWLAFKEKWSK